MRTMVKEWYFPKISQHSYIYYGVYMLLTQEGFDVERILAWNTSMYNL